MLWSEFLTGLDKIRSDIRAGRPLQAKIEDADPILSTFRSLIVLQPIPEEKPEKSKDTEENVPASEGARELQVGEVRGYVEPRTTKLVVRPPVLEDGEDALAGEDKNE